MKIQENSLWRQACYINGEWIPTGENGIPVTNPVDDSVLGFVPRLGEEETKEPLRRRRLPGLRGAICLPGNEVCCCAAGGISYSRISRNSPGC